MPVCSSDIHVRYVLSIAPGPDFCVDIRQPRFVIVGKRKAETALRYHSLVWHELNIMAIRIVFSQMLNYPWDIAAVQEMSDLDHIDPRHAYRYGA